MIELLWHGQARANRGLDAHVRNTLPLRQGSNHLVNLRHLRRTGSLVPQALQDAQILRLNRLLDRLVDKPAFDPQLNTVF